jgi:hypothetical protein
VKLFKCQHCGQILYFENTVCERCSYRLGYLPDLSVLAALEPAGDAWRPLGNVGETYRFCANAELKACNWLVAAASDHPLCACCRHNRTVPDLSDERRLVASRKLEVAKHRLFYSILRLRLPVDDRPVGPARHLAFDFLAESPLGDAPRVMTGHDNGLITIALAEADDVEREKNRTSLHEPYRTLLGHFRHEIGHYFWDRLVQDAGRLEGFRAVFGDERADYGEALQRYYATGAPIDWQQQFVTAYAACHPWEDFAETWAHYLHIVDTLEIAGAFEMLTHPNVARGQALDATVDFDPYEAGDIRQIVDTWVPLSLALNSLNRAMGQSDLYPFVISNVAIEKLGFIHETIRSPAA